MLLAHVLTFLSLLAAPGSSLRGPDQSAQITMSGRFGAALNAAEFPVQVEPAEAYAHPPLTVECWVLVRGKDQFQILVACEPKESATHWELYTQINTGFLSFYAPGYNPADIISSRDVADGAWHHVAAQVSADQIRLYVDGELVREAARSRQPGGRRQPGPLTVGMAIATGGALGCDGLIDDLRIRKGLQPLARAPGAPLTADEHTIGLWSFDTYSAREGFTDASPRRAALRTTSRPGVALEQLDREAFGVSTHPFARPLIRQDWRPAAPLRIEPRRTAGAEELLLDGDWDCLGFARHGVAEERMLAEEAAWRGAIRAPVPGSIQTALLRAGRIDDPMLLRNNLEIEDVPRREWWLRRRFMVPAGWQGRRIRLVFDGVDYRATFWLNGCRLGQHENMWGGPEFDVERVLRPGRQNTLVVRLDPAPPELDDNFKINVAYGWHYVRLVTLGLWRSVRLQARGATRLEHPFLTTRALTRDGVTTALSVDMWHEAPSPAALALECRLTPKNFQGPSLGWTRRITVRPGMNRLGFAGHAPAARLWWPNGLGFPAVYQFTCQVRDARGRLLDRYVTNWGARTVRAASTPRGKRSNEYSWQLVVNNRPVFVKGTNWCYPDALLRLDRVRQQRFIVLAKHAHIQLIRIWGGGPAENDALYDLCDEQGIMTQQEFPMHAGHRLDVLPSYLALEMARQSIQRLRNRPSLAIWCGSNETSGVGRIHEVLGRRSYELDGTRPVRRTSPYGGDLHYYGVYWGDADLKAYREISRRPPAITEWGLSSPASMETWKRVLPASELQQWPPARDAVFVHHTPTYDYQHVTKMTRYAGDFLEPKSLRDLVLGMQLSQGLGFQFVIESMRARKPEATATYFYKLTENYPACSWASVDYYGYPKLSHYLARRAYSPVHAFATFADWNSRNNALPLELHAVNDTLQPVRARLRATLYDGALRPVSEEDRGEITVPTDRAAGFPANLRVPEGTPRPLLLLVTLTGARGEIARNWYFFDFTQESGSLFRLPRTRLEAAHTAEGIRIKNVGGVPAIGVTTELGAAGDSYYAEDALMWLQPGEARTVRLHRTPAPDGTPRALGPVTVTAWNAEDTVAAR